MNLKFYFIKNEDLSHGSFHFCFLKANNTGYINILGVFKNKWFLACISRKKTLWLHSNFLSNLMFGRSYDFSQIAFLETNSVYILGNVEFSLIVWFDVSDLLENVSLPVVTFNVNNRLQRSKQWRKCMVSYIVKSSSRRPNWTEREKLGLMELVRLMIALSAKWEGRGY